MKTLKSIVLIAVLLLAVIQTSHAQEIFDAVKNDELARVKLLIDKDASLINNKDDAGNTTLHQAVIIGSVEIADFLLSRGADINAQNTQKNTPLHEAIQSRKENTARLLIERGTDVNLANTANQTPLHLAAMTDQSEIGEMLIDRDATIDPVDIYGRTPFLLVARQNGNVAFGKRLLEKGADIHVKDRDNQMALNLAAWRGFNDFIDFLLDHEAEYDTTRLSAFWMLRFAANCGSQRLFQVVLNNDNTLLLEENQRSDIMRTAIMGGSVDIVKYLLSKDIPLNDQANRCGWTPLHYAAANGHAAIIRFLKENNIDIDKKTLSGRSAFIIAEENKQGEVLRMIKELKGDTSPRRFPILSGPYLGQTPPVNGPALFAPDIVSSSNGDDNHGSIAFMPDGKELYWNLKGKIWMMKLENGRWTEPEITPFGQGESIMDDNPFITSDGKKMFFTSTRSGAVSERKENIWYVERTSTGWSEPKPVSPEVNAIPLHWSLSVSNSGTLYFGGTGQENYGRGDIYYSKLVNGIYTRPVNAGPEINSKESEICPYIAPDESYIIFTRFGPEGQNYYVGYRDKSGQWLSPVKIYETLEGVCPTMSPDGRYFFFNSDGIYWMDAQFIEALKPKN